MKSILKTIMILSLALFLTGCLNNDLKQSRTVALQWAEAELQWDGNQRMELLTPAAKLKYKYSQHTTGEAINPGKTIENYQMQEWKINNDSYVYRLVYPDDTAYDTTWTQTKRTENGWGITRLILPYYQALEITDGIEPTIVKELD